MNRSDILPAMDLETVKGVNMKKYADLRLLDETKSKDKEGKMSEKMEPKWADPNPAGSLLIACLLIATGALFVGFVPSSCTPLVMVNSIMVGITLLIIAIISFKNGDIMGGTLNFVFGTIFAIGLSSSGLSQFVIPYFLGSVSNGALIAPVAKIP